MTEVIPGTRVVATNPRHVNLGTGVVQQVRGAQAKVEFPAVGGTGTPLLPRREKENIGKKR